MSQLHLPKPKPSKEEIKADPKPDEEIQDYPTGPQLGPYEPSPQETETDVAPVAETPDKPLKEETKKHKKNEPSIEETKTDVTPEEATKTKVSHTR